jgi:hypothetical protein
MLGREEQSTGVIRVTNVSVSHRGDLDVTMAAQVAITDYSQKLAVHKHFLLYVAPLDSR